MPSDNQDPNNNNLFPSCGTAALCLSMTTLAGSAMVSAAVYNNRGDNQSLTVLVSSASALVCELSSVVAVSGCLRARRAARVVEPDNRRRPPEPILELLLLLGVTVGMTARSETPGGSDSARV
ncbi:hypothetical protein N8772_02740 [Rickettsiales bacterium]|nr:hypothetical protein [Rickettsiales bacterium]MDB2550882.1 hypothetical protein [Rickettsiales bacterium]